MGSNGSTAGIGRGIGLATGPETVQTTGVRIEGSRLGAMTGGETMRDGLDDIENEATRQVHIGGEDTPETGVATTEDELVDRFVDDATVLRPRGTRGVRAQEMVFAIRILP